MDTLPAFSIIGFLGVITFVPVIIVRTKTDNLVWWWVATICTGIVPGLLASILYRYTDTPAMSAFFWGVLASIGIGIVIAYLMGAL